ncbi:MAG: hypothetical protein WBD22_03075 [Pyrinomonadaceae bacterium]
MVSINAIWTYGDMRMPAANATKSQARGCLLKVSGLVPIAILSGSICNNEMADFSEAFVTEAGHQHQVLRPPKRTVSLTMTDYLRGQLWADLWNFFEFLGASGVNVYAFTSNVSRI